MPNEAVIDLKVSVKDGKSCERVLTIEVPGEDIQREYDAFYKAVGPQAKVPGFRPGKAPRDVIAMHFKKEARENVLKNLITDSYRQALQKKSLEPLGYPEIEKVQFQDDKLSFQAKIEVRPKIKLSKVTGLPVTRESAEVKPEEVEASLKRLQESLAQYKAVEDRPVAMGDSIIVDYVCCAGKEIEKREGDWIELRGDGEYFKGFSAQLVGAQIGEEKEVKVNFPEETHHKDLAGKPAIFKVKIKEIKTKTLPPFDDELAKEAGEFKTLAELKERIEKNLQSLKEREKEAAFEKSLLDELVKQNKVELPERLVGRRLEYLIERRLEDYHRRGFLHETLDEMGKSLQTDLAEEARRQVHLAFLLDEIAVREKIEITHEDLKKKYETIAAGVRRRQDDIEKYYAENEEAREGLRDQLRGEKTIEWLKHNAK